MRAFADVFRSPAGSSFGNALALDARGLCVRRDGRLLLDAVSLSLRAGELVGLIGPNGAGKSTLLRCLAGLLCADSGSLQLGGRDLPAMGAAARARLIGYLPQQARIDWDLSVRRVIELGRLPHLPAFASLSDADHARVLAAAERTGLGELLDAPVHRLSGGERMRVLLARLLAGDTAHLFADEPIASLDPRQQLQTLELFRQHCRQAGLAIVVLHDLELAARFCDRLLLLDKGRLLADGDPETVLSQPSTAAAYGVQLRLRRSPDGLSVRPVLDGQGSGG